jgi:Thioesterase-like superfamily
VLAAGKAVSQLTVDLRGEDGSLSTRAHVVTGAARVSNVTVAALGPASPDAEKDPDSAGIEFPYLEGITPVFTQHMAMRWCGPAFPYTGSGPEGAVVRAWVQHRTQATGLGAVLALMDACPPAILPLVSQAAPASTVRWTAHLVADLPPDVTGRWFWYEAETVQARDGYAIEESRLFLDGALVAWSEQLVAVFDRPSAS